MNARIRPLARAVLLLSFTASLALAEDDDSVVFQGMCDASAASAIDAERFIVADDEENILRVYDRAGGPALGQFDLSGFLGTVGKKKTKEADIEGAAQIGTRTFWITSHGRNSKAQETPERQRIFATAVRRDGDGLRIEPVGRPYISLIDDLLRDKRLARYRLADAILLAPKAAGGMNIEGLGATPEGHLLIGFRSPLDDGRALIVPLLNPGEIIEGQRARLSDPLEVDLGGLGIRSLGYCAGRYLIIAGSTGEGGGGSRLYEWKGGAAPARRVPGISFRGLNPEGVAFHSGDGAAEYFVLSDDGTTEIDGQACKDLKDPTLKRFRGRPLKL